MMCSESPIQWKIHTEQSSSGSYACDKMHEYEDAKQRKRRQERHQQQRTQGRQHRVAMRGN